MIRRLWRRFWERAPRQLRFTRAGTFVTGIALAVGFAAVNTGNNLLFLGWGLVLSGIVLSGVLSEATLRVIDVKVERTPLLRVGQKGRLPVALTNRSRLFPSFGLEGALAVAHQRDEEECPLPYQIKMPAKERRTVWTGWRPAARGAHTFTRASVSTLYPFGFFSKTRRIPLGECSSVFVAPERVSVAEIVQGLMEQGESSGRAQQGNGDDFFSLRPYRAGDDRRRIHWRKTAQTRRWVVIENEAQWGDTLLVELWVGEPSEQNRASVERAIAVFGSVCETLLEQGFAVGARAAGLYVSPQPGAQQVRRILAALARMTPSEPVPRLPSRSPHRVALTCGALPSPRAPCRVDIQMSAHARGA